MADHASPMVIQPGGEGPRDKAGSRWLAALLVGLLLLLTLLIGSWFLRACAPVEPSTNLTLHETPAPPAPLPAPDPSPMLKTALGEAQADEKNLRAELAALAADLQKKVEQCKPIEAKPPPPPPPPPVARPTPAVPLPADRWAK